MNVTLYCRETNFIEGIISVSFSCSSITVNTVTVNSPTELVVNISIADDAFWEICELTVITGDKTVRRKNAFEVISYRCRCIDVEPDSAKADKTVDIAIVPECEMFDRIPEVDFACDDITVNDIKIVSETEIVVNISIDKKARNCIGDVAVTTDNRTVTCENAFEVFAAKCTLTDINPDTVRAGLFLPRLRVIEIISSKPHFDSASEIIFDGSQENDIRVLFSDYSSSEKLKALIFIPAGTKQGDYDVSVVTGDEVCTGGALTIQ